MKRPLIAGTRPAGCSEYDIVIYGQRENRFPPARLTGPLRELARWLDDGRETPRPARRPHLRAL